MRVKINFYFLLLAVFSVSCKDNKKPVEPPPPQPTTSPVTQINYTITGYFPHDITSFTEGLLFHEAQLFESTGATPELSQTRSLFGVVDLKTGRIDSKAELDRNIYFGEGIVFLNNKVFQLTYKNQLCFVYDASTFRQIRQYHYNNKEGWGLTTEGTYVIMSDGTNILTYFDPESFKVIKTIGVTEDGRDVQRLNELEYIKGFIYANVWPENMVVKIDPADGKVVGKLDLNPIKQSALAKYHGALETNGIAYDTASDKIYITGKMWPDIVQINFAH